MIEHEYTRKVNAKINVYNLEIALLELGPKREPNRGKGQHINLPQWAWQHLGEGKSFLYRLTNNLMVMTVVRIINMTHFF